MRSRQDWATYLAFYVVLVVGELVFLPLGRAVSHRHQYEVTSVFAVALGLATFFALRGWLRRRR